MISYILVHSIFDNVLFFSFWRGHNQSEENYKVAVDSVRLYSEWVSSSSKDGRRSVIRVLEIRVKSHLIPISENSETFPYLFGCAMRLIKKLCEPVCIFKCTYRIIKANGDSWWLLLKLGHLHFNWRFPPWSTALERLSQPTCSKSLGLCLTSLAFRWYSFVVAQGGLTSAWILKLRGKVSWKRWGFYTV